MSQLKGRIAMVTGAGSGLGRASARALAARGACVAVADLNDEDVYKRQILGAHRAVSMYGNPDFRFDETHFVHNIAYSAAATGSVIAAATKEGAVNFLDHPAVNPVRSGSWSMDVNHLFPHTHIDCGPGGFWTHQFWPCLLYTSRCV